MVVDRIPFSRCTRPIYPSPSSLSFLPKPYTPFRSRLSFSAPALESNHLASAPSGPRQVPCSRTRWLCFPLPAINHLLPPISKNNSQHQIPRYLFPKLPPQNLNSPLSFTASYRPPADARPPLLGAPHAPSRPYPNSGTAPPRPGVVWQPGLSTLGHAPSPFIARPRPLRHDRARPRYSRRRPHSEAGACCARSPSRPTSPLPHSSIHRAAPCPAQRIPHSSSQTRRMAHIPPTRTRSPSAASFQLVDRHLALEWTYWRAHLIT